MKGITLVHTTHPALFGSGRSWACLLADQCHHVLTSRCCSTFHTGQWILRTRYIIYHSHWTTQLQPSSLPEISPNITTPYEWIVWGSGALWERYTTRSGTWVTSCSKVGGTAGVEFLSTSKPVGKWFYAHLGGNNVQSSPTHYVQLQVLVGEPLTFATSCWVNRGRTDHNRRYVHFSEPWLGQFFALFRESHVDCRPVINHFYRATTPQARTSDVTTTPWQRRTANPIISRRGRVFDASGFTICIDSINPKRL